MKAFWMTFSAFLCRDGTTDVTRTIHLGTPSDYEKECFTHVLKGHIALASAVWPNGVKGNIFFFVIWCFWSVRVERTNVVVIVCGRTNLPPPSCPLCGRELIMESLGMGPD